MGFSRSVILLSSSTFITGVRSKRRSGTRGSLTSSDNNERDLDTVMESLRQVEVVVVVIRLDNSFKDVN